MVSYNGSRRNRPSWWSEEEWAKAQQVNEGPLKHYYLAKVEADECLTALAKQRPQGFQDILLRPGALTDDGPTGRVMLGKGKASGKVSRADVADVAARLLETDDAKGWYDLLEGQEPVGEAVNRVVKGKVDCVEGEDVEAMVNKFK